MWSVAAAVGKSLGSGTPGRRRRRPRPISSGPKRGRPTRRVTDPTSRAAIRRSEARRGLRTTGPKPPRGRGPKRTTRTINTGHSGWKPSSTRRPRRLSSRTTRAAIARSRARLARRR